MTRTDYTVSMILIPKDIYSAYEAASILGISVKRIWMLSHREEDPFPLRRYPGMQRSSIVISDELMGWVKRNYHFVGECKKRP